MRISEYGISFVKEREGFRAKAYQCEAGKWTIGYGETEGVKPGDTITKEVADQNLRIRLARLSEHISNLVAVPLKQHQFDALVIFADNVGRAAFQRSDLLRLVNLGVVNSIPDELRRWKWVTLPSGEKVESPGLLKRRNLEGDLWLNEPIPSQ